MFHAQKPSKKCLIGVLSCRFRASPDVYQVPWIPPTLYQFITGDFEWTWNSLAENKKTISGGSGGNFMFALQVMILMEFISRLCTSEGPPYSSLKAFSQELNRINPDYFKQLPGTCLKSNEFQFPSMSYQGAELLAGLYDLIRNGQAHHYHQILANLSDKKQWVVSIRVPRPGRGFTLSKLQAASRSWIEPNTFEDNEKERSRLYNLQSDPPIFEYQRCGQFYKSSFQKESEAQITTCEDYPG